jgi:hypothetical protein
MGLTTYNAAAFSSGGEAERRPGFLDLSPEHPANMAEKDRLRVQLFSRGLKQWKN